MIFSRIILYSLAGFALQLILNVLAFYWGLKNWLLMTLVYIYSPWTSIGETLDRSSGSGGHAMQGGWILGYLVGILVYSLLIGIIIYLLKNGAFLNKRK